MVREVPLSARGRGSRPRGVTLLEILVAVAVLGVGLATIFQIFPMGFAASAKSAATTLAFELASQKLEEIRNNHLFGGIPGTASADDLYFYWGNKEAPNPDKSAFTEVNTNGQYRAFSTTSVPEKNYFYRVDCLPVIDPARKYAEFPYTVSTSSGNLSRGFATMYRISVTVRGPLQSLAEAADDQWQNNALLKKGAVQVQLATYVANKALGDALLQCEPGMGRNAKFLPVARDTTDDSNIIHVLGIGQDYPFPENFTVFQAGGLSDPERMDTGPTIYDPATGRSADVVNGMNRYGLDNVLIFESAGPGRYIAESNKIIAIYAPDEVGNRSTTYWQFNLLNRLYARDNDYPARVSEGSAYLLDSTYDGEATGPGGKIGYSEGSVSGGNITGARIRFLMKLEQTP